MLLSLRVFQVLACDAWVRASCTFGPTTNNEEESHDKKGMQKEKLYPNHDDITIWRVLN